MESSMFEERLRVLVIDDDPVCFKIITRMLKLCNYDVTEVAKATEALETLRNNPQSFDMVITDSCNDMDVISLVVNIMKMENISVIIVSSSDINSTLIQGVIQGAEEIMSKPVSLEKIKTLWQHVYRRKLISHKNKPLSSDSVHSTKEEVEKKEDKEETDNEEEESEQRRKKSRVKWQGSLQDKFEEAVMQLGGPNEAMPKKIMELMNVPVSRESVASHLQKYMKQKKPVQQRLETNIHHHHNRPPLPSASCYHSNANNFQYRGNQWSYPKVNPGLGAMPDQHPAVLPPHPSFAVPVSCRGPVPPQPCYNYGRYEIVPQPLPAVVTAVSTATEIDYKFSGDPWHDSAVLEAGFLSGLQPGVDEWFFEDFQTVANGAMLSAQRRDQVEDGS